MGFTQEQDDQFGDGESVGGDGVYDPPVYVSADDDDECTEYTYSEGKNGQFLIADGHKSATEFYERDERGRSYWTCSLRASWRTLSWSRRFLIFKYK